MLVYVGGSIHIDMIGLSFNIVRQSTHLFGIVLCLYTFVRGIISKWSTKNITHQRNKD
jgi:hypothetical protein